VDVAAVQQYVHLGWAASWAGVGRVPTPASAMGLPPAIDWIAEYQAPEGKLAFQESRPTTSTQEQSG
jgi:hypothetical protein